MGRSWTFKAGYGQVTGGLWILLAGHRQWEIIGKLKFMAYFELLYSFCVVDFYSAF